MGRISRRQLIAAAGGSLALVPLLSSRLGRAAPTTFPKRLLVLQATNGVLSAWWPTGSGTSFTLSDQLAPLAPYQNDIFICKGISIKVQEDQPNNGAAHQALPYLLTGSVCAPGPDQAGFTLPLGNSISLDQFVANKLPATPIKSLQLGAYYVDGALSARSISYNGPAIGMAPDDNPPEINPYNVFNRLMQVGSNSTDPAVAAAKVRKKTVLDAVTGDLNAMLAKIDSDDKAKVETHLASVASLEAELSATAAACSLTPPAAGIPLDVPSNQLDTILKAQIDLTVMAFACGITQVSTLMMVGPHNNTICFPWLGSEFAVTSGGIQGDHHGIAHSAGDGNAGTWSDQKMKVDTWYNSIVAYAIAKLKSVPEGSGTMFDNTLVLFVNHMGNGAAHSLDNIPVILAGGSWYLKGGRFVDYGGVPHNGVLVGIANAFGANVTSFGDAAYGGELANFTG